MTLNLLIQRLQWLVEDGFSAEIPVTSIKQFSDFIEIKLQNGTVGQIDAHSVIWKPLEETT